MSVDALTIWLRLQALLWAVALTAAVWIDVPYLVAGLPLAAILSGLSIVALAAVLRAGRTIADVATLLRGAGLVALLAAAGSLQPWTMWAIAALVAAADLVDGALARRYGATANGAVLDMETDQLVVLGLSLLVVTGGGGPHVLLLPMMRYAFVLAAWSWQIPACDPKPVDGDNRRGRAVCAAVMIALLLALLPGAPAVLGDLATGVAVLLLTWSFSSDWTFLFAHRRPARAGG